MPADRDAFGHAIKNSGGLRKATTDEAQIVAWWKKWPDAMIGAATGPGMAAFVVDFDIVDKKTGEIFELNERIAALEAAIGAELPATAMAATPSGGCHLYFALPALAEGLKLGNRNKGLPFKIDVRGDDTGYVIVPPSKRMDGAEYRWLRRYSQVGVLPAPARLIELLTERPKAKPAPAGNVVAFPPQPRPRASGDPVAEAIARYGEAALAAECRLIRSAPSGWRNSQLNESALKIASLTVSTPLRALEPVQARQAIEAAARDNPGDDDDRQMLATIDSGWTAGEGNPRDLAEIAAKARHRAERDYQRAERNRERAAGRLDPSAGSAPHPARGDDGKPPFRGGSAAGNGSSKGGGGQDGDDALQRHRRLAFRPQTDLGNAERFYERHGQDFRFCPALGWLAWDGRRWEMMPSDPKGPPPARVLRAVYDTVRAIGEEAKAVEESGWREDAAPLLHKPDEREGGLNFIAKWRGKEPISFAETLRAWSRASESAARIGCISALAKAWLTVGVEEFDRNLFAINMLNGTIEVFRTLENGVKGAGWRFRPHDRADLITKLAPVMFDKSAQAPEYDKFIGRVQPDAPMQRFLHQWGGYSLTGDIGEARLLFYHGGGRNGKSVLMNAWAAVAGEYSSMVPIETFLQQGIARRGDQASPDIARLGGIRMLRTSEAEKGSKLAESLIKLVTGGEPIPTRHLHREMFDLIIRFKLTIAGNQKPGMTGTDDGIWERMTLVPWMVQIPREERDKQLGEKLKAEVSGIFNRLLDGMMDWLVNGLVLPDAVDQATRKFREESDTLGRFLSFCTENDPAARTQSSRLHAVFVAWARASGEKEWSQKGFTNAMQDRGFEKKASDGMQWLGIKLIREVHEFVDADGKPIDFKGSDPPLPAAPPTPAGWQEEDDDMP